MREFHYVIFPAMKKRCKFMLFFSEIWADWIRTRNLNFPDDSRRSTALPIHSLIRDQILRDRRVFSTSNYIFFTYPLNNLSIYQGKFSRCERRAFIHDKKRKPPFDLIIMTKGHRRRAFCVFDSRFYRNTIFYFILSLTPISHLRPAIPFQLSSARIASKQWRVEKTRREKFFL